MANDSEVTVDFAGQTVVMPAGGYYDRFRMNPDLDVVARDPEAGGIAYFRRIPKQPLPSRLGPLWAPNFFYRTSHIQLLMLAPVDRLRSMLPEPLEPLRAYPGHGLVALTFFSYHVCDNDPYNEVSVAVVVRRPHHEGSNVVELLDAVRRRSFHAHVLALPVTTEIARVRGVFAYELPKWRADIEVTVEERARAQIKDAAGVVDLALDATLPPMQTVPSQARMSTNTMLHRVDGQWHQTRVQSNTLAFGQKLFPRAFQLTRGRGPLSELLDGLGTSTAVRLDVIRDAQVVLHLPTPIPSPG